MPSRRRLRLLLLSGLLVGAAALALRLRTPEPEPPEPVPEPVETWKKDDRLLDRLRGAPLPASPEPIGDDWPQWRGPRRDGISDAKLSPSAWPPRALWKVPGGAGHSAVAVANGRAVTMIQDGDNEVVLCLDAATGAELWRHAAPAKFFENYAGPGPHATPTLAGGRVYAVGATGILTCLDAANGKPLWSHDLPKEFECAVPDYGYSGSPLLEGPLVIVVPGSAKKGAVAAFDRETGALAWTSPAGPPGYSSPLAATINGLRQIVAFTGQSISGLSPADGSPIWSRPWITHRECNIATPIVAGSYVFVSSGYAKGCGLLEIGDETTWVYEHNRMRNQFSTCVAAGDHLYGFDEAFLASMELRTGKVLWKQRGFDRGSVLLAGRHLIVLGENGKLALVAAEPGAYRELSSLQLTKSKCWAPPALARRKLYLRDQEFIFCLDLGGVK